MGKPLTCYVVTVFYPDRVEQKVVDEKAFTMGRSLEATLAFSDSNISRTHLEITTKRGQVHVEDLESANGTFVNGQKISTREAVAIQPTDKIKLGTSVIEVSLALIERVFKKDDMKNPALNPHAQEIVVGIIEGAHNEAQRVITLGQAQHDQLVRTGLAKGQQIEQQALTYHNDLVRSSNEEGSRIIAEAKSAAAQIVQQGEDQKSELIKAGQQKVGEAERYINSRYDSLDAELEKHRAERLSSIDDEVKSIIARADSDAASIRQRAENEGKAKGQKYIDEANTFVFEARTKAISEAEITVDNAEKEAKELIYKAKDQALSEKTEILRLANEEAEKLKIELIDAAKLSWEKELADKRQAFSNEESELIANISKHRVEANQLSQAVSSLTHQKLALEPQVSTLSRELAEKNTQATELSRKVTELESTLKHVLDSVSENRNGLATIESQIQYRKTELERLQELERNYHKRSEELHNQVRQAELENERSIELFKKSQSEHEQKLSELNSNYQFEIERMDREKETHALALRLENEKLKVDLSSNMERLRRDYEKLSADLATTQANLSKARSDHSDYTTKLSTLEPKYAAIRHELDQYGATKAELEKSIERLTTTKEEQLDLIANSKERFDAVKSEIDIIAKQRHELSEQVSQAQAALTQVKSQYAELIENISGEKAQHERMLSARSHLEKEIENLQDKYNSSLKQLGNLTQQAEEKSSALATIEADYQNQLRVYKGKVEEEQRRILKEEIEKTNQLKLAEMSSVTKLKNDMLAEISAQRYEIIKDLHRGLELEIVKHMDASQWRSISSGILNQMSSQFENSTASLYTSTGSVDLKKNPLFVKRKRERIALAVMSFVFGIGTLWSANFVRGQLDQRSFQQVVDDRIKKDREEYEKRRFQPPQDDELRSTYAESVVYTRDFVRRYSNDEYQGKFNKAVIDYFLKSWRVDEEVSIQVTSAIYSLVSTLEERRQQIHPDFVKENLEKMHALEKETVSRMADLLGSKVKYEAFKKFEKKYYQNETDTRIPANEPSSEDQSDSEEASLSKDSE